MPRIRQNISTDNLFHFTPKLEFLKEIFENRALRARYVYEESPFSSYRVDVTMKCFCDIPLGMIKKHMSSYGQYGIGITKNFAKLNGISPVIYVHQKSETKNRFSETMRRMHKELYASSLAPFFKKDEKVRNGKIGQNLTTRYYDEREWRWIPKDASCELFNGKNEEEHKKRTKVLNASLDLEKRDFSLPISSTDISYIFVRSNDDLDEIVETLERFTTDRSEKNKLISKIITMIQIERDF